MLCSKEMDIMVVVSCLALGLCLSWTDYCSDENTKTQSNLGRKGFVWFACLSPSSSLGEAKTKTQGLEARTDTKTMDECCLVICSSLHTQP